MVVSLLIHNAFYKDVSLVIDVSCDVDRAAAETDGDISISWGWRGNQTLTTYNLLS